MAKRITTYRELLEEKKRLEQLAAVQQEQVKNDITALKEGFQASIGLFITRKTTHLLTNLGINFVIDLLVKKLVPARTSRFLRLAIRIILKNFVSHFVDQPEKIVRRIMKWFTKKSPAERHQSGMEAV